MKVGVPRMNIKHEFMIEELPYTFDFAIIGMPNKNNTKYKGILVELNGPHHLYNSFDETRELPINRMRK